MLKDIQTDLATELAAIELFDNVVDVIPATAGEIESRVRTALGKLGLVVVIEPVTGRIGWSNGKPVITLACEILIFENVLLNRASSGTGITAEEAVEAIILTLTPAAGRKVNPSNLELVDDLGKLLVYRINCTGMFTLVAS